MATLNDYLELIRIPNVFTAQADILAGFLIAGGGIHEIHLFIYLLCASSFLYSAGIVLNDTFDYSVDLKERPHRPIPSGRIKRREALSLGVIFLVVGAFLSTQVSGTSFIISLFLIVSIVSYNGGIKKLSWLGPANMGGCRYLNLLLGLSVFPLSSHTFLLPLLTGVFVFGVTVLSQWETRDEHLAFPTAISIGSIIAVLALYALFFRWEILFQKSGLCLCAIWALLSSGYLMYALMKKSHAHTQKTVTVLILSLVILDGIIVAGIRPVYWALTVWILLFPTTIIARKFYVT